jgi:hypothetical protein
LGKEFVPKLEREIIGDPCQYADEVQFEVMDGHFGGIAVMTARWDKFKGHLVCVPDEVFHCHGDLIVQDMFAQCDSGPLEVENQCGVSLGEFSIGAILDGLNKDGATVDLHHNHDVLVARLGVLWQFSCLVSKNGVTHVVYLGVDILHFAPLELIGVHIFEGSLFGFGGADVLASLVEVSLGCLTESG